MEKRMEYEMETRGNIGIVRAAVQISYIISWTWVPFWGLYETTSWRPMSTVENPLMMLGCRLKVP